MVEVRVDWVDRIMGIFVDCLKPRVVKIELRFYLLGIINQKIKHFSLFLPLFDVFSFPLFHGFLLFVKRRMFFFVFGSFLALKTSCEGDLNILFVFVLFIVALSPI